MKPGGQALGLKGRLEVREVDLKHGWFEAWKADLKPGRPIKGPDADLEPGGTT